MGEQQHMNMAKQLLVLLALAAGCTAKISLLTVTDDVRRVFAIESFGFLERGVHEMMISGVETPTDTAGFIFMRQTPEAIAIVEESSAEGGLCLYNAVKDNQAACASTQCTTVPLKNGPMGPVTVTIEGEYRAYFANCAGDSSVSFEVKLTQLNPGSDGHPFYLSAGEAPLPTVFLLVSMLWLGASIVWIRIICANGEFTKSIHHLMTVLVCLKFLSVFSEAIKFHVMKVDGTAHGWTAVYYTFAFLKGILMFTVILLIGTGWSLFKPVLNDKDKKIVAIVIPLQIITNIAGVYVDENMRGSSGWLTWRDLLHLMDIACCCAILFPIVWSIKHLRDAAGTDGKAARNMERLRLFRQFYIMVVAYVYFTRIVVFLMGATLPFGYSWVGNLIYESATMAFYSLTGYRFQPIANNPYLMIPEEDDDADQDSVPTAATATTIPLNAPTEKMEAV